MGGKILCSSLTSDIDYLIESDEPTASDKLHITQGLPTQYSIDLMGLFHLKLIEYSLGVLIGRLDTN